nr:NADH dehydrogenase subunit 6 [Upeneus nigromarginatus]
MSQILAGCLIIFVVGAAGVAANPSPYFGALALVCAAGVGCGVLITLGGTFLSLILFLIYLGGMLVVFAYTAALAADEHPEAFGSSSVLLHMGSYFLWLGPAAYYLSQGWYDVSGGCADESEEYSSLRRHTEGVGLIYLFGGLPLMLSGGALALALIVVLALVRGLAQGAVRAV